jgi:dephospho-CoA kinase
MQTIGLTGGIAMGKTAVSDYLSHLGCTVADADRLARQAVLPGSAILAAIAARYPGVLTLDGQLDRPKLAQIIFSNPDEKAWVEGQIHPYVRSHLQTIRDESLSITPEKPVVLVIPLLFEAGMSDLVTEIWVVYCPKVQQLDRLMARDRLSLDQAMARLASQWPIEEKCDRAQIVLKNDSTLDALYAQIDVALHRAH